jgi:hypothetical protein
MKIKIKFILFSISYEMGITSVGACPPIDPTPPRALARSPENSSQPEEWRSPFIAIMKVMAEKPR